MFQSPHLNRTRFVNPLRLAPEPRREPWAGLDEPAWSEPAVLANGWFHCPWPCAANRKLLSPTPNGLSRGCSVFLLQKLHSAVDGSITTVDVAMIFPIISVDAPAQTMRIRRSPLIKVKRLSILRGGNRRI